jgi:hypothetical protein
MASKLDLFVRPVVLFDATNKKHREFFSNYLSTGSWGNCPYRFVVQDDYGNLIGHIQRELLEYYMGREFKEMEIKQTKIFPQKAKKTVDKRSNRK